LTWFDLLGNAIQGNLFALAQSQGTDTQVRHIFAADAGSLVLVFVKQIVVDIQL
jgi:hypothetical protein